jgi:hypothetical protein
MSPRPMLLCSGLLLCLGPSQLEASDDQIEQQKRELVRRYQEIEKNQQDATERINREYSNRYNLPPSQRRQIEALKHDVDEINAERCLKLDMLSFVQDETTAANTIDRVNFQNALSVVEAKKEAASADEKEALVAEYRKLMLRLSEGFAKIVSAKACGNQENSYYLALNPAKIAELKSLAMMPADDLERRIFDKDTGVLYATCSYIKLRVPNYSCE